MPASAIQVREALASDLPTINDIYNEYIIHTTITFDEEPWSLQQREQWFSQYTHGPHTVLVAANEGLVVGFAYTSPFRYKSAFQRSAEVTIYTHKEAPKGLGTRLYRALILAVEEHFHRLYAMITLPNEKSLALHAKFGFRAVGNLDDVGYKFGRYHSVAIYEKQMPDKFTKQT